MYVIRNIKQGNYYDKTIKDVNHFVTYLDDAKKYSNKRDANKDIKLFKHIENFELVKYEEEDKNV